MTAAGAAMFLVKMKAHRGEPVHEEANMQADTAISNKVTVVRAVFKW